MVGQGRMNSLSVKNRSAQADKGDQFQFHSHSFHKTKWNEEGRNESWRNWSRRARESIHSVSLQLKEVKNEWWTASGLKGSIQSSFIQLKLIEMKFDWIGVYYNSNLPLV